MTKLLVGISLMVLLVAVPAMASTECHKHELSGEQLTYTAHETGEHTFKGGSAQSHNGYLITVYLEEGETWTVPTDGAAISHVVVCEDPSTTTTVPPSTTTTTAEPPTTTTTTASPTTTSTLPPTTTTSTAPPATTTTTTDPEPTTTTVPVTSTTVTTPPFTELPRTGVSMLQLTVAAIWLLFFGTLIVTVARFMRRN